MKQFLYYYLRSMRLYYNFVTGATTLAGLLILPVHGWNWQYTVTLLIGFTAWGVNQIFSDWLDRKEDAVNAPHRPMVTGKLAARPALLLSVGIMVLFAVLVFFISPRALLILLAGGLLNSGYSLAKPLPVLNCVVYGLAICCCFCLGAEVRGVAPEDHIRAALLYILPAHVLMCSFSYYKDKAGDRAAGIRTLQTLYPDGITLPLHALAGIIYTFFLLHFSGLGASLLFFLQIIVLTLLIFRLAAKKYHSATCLNCQLCVLWLFSFCCNTTPVITAAALGSFVLIWLLFQWYSDDKE